jgi:nicotinamidase-related amidase
MKNTNLLPEKCMIVVIDVQERLAPAMKNLEPMLKKTEMLLDGGRLLGVDTVLTEQYPKGLGTTVETVRSHLDAERTPVLEKTAFSCFGSTKFCAHLTSINPKTLVLCGIETHVCVLQTARDAVARGYNVVLAIDAVSSRTDTDRDAALDYLREIGVQLRSVESILFDWLKDARHPQFKTVSKLVR